MRLLFAVSEVMPFSKTGGLADVAGALPKALARAGHEPLVVSPWYPALGGPRSPTWIGDVPVPFDGGFEEVGVGVLDDGAVRFAFVGHPDFRRDAPYGYADDPRRFARFTRAVPAVAERLAFAPEVLHAHDWHTGFLPALAARGWHLPPSFAYLPSVFTLHNVQYQGPSDPAATLQWLRLPADLPPEAFAHAGLANPLVAGTHYAQRVTTVSPTYAREITEREAGFGLEAVFRAAGGKLDGILNGLDTEVWDPAHDPHLAAPYDAEAPEGKAETKAALTGELGLEPERPLLGVVSRFAEQKGIDLLLAALDGLLEDGWTVALLGAGDAALERSALDAARRRPERVAVRLGQSEPLAHRIFAAADAVAVPSRFEPCGLTQLVAMRYGALPVVRDTGGLRDTVEHAVTGFVFQGASADALAGALRQAQAALDDGRGARMRARAMRRDFGWDRSARAYEDTYRAAVEAARRETP